MGASKYCIFASFEMHLCLFYSRALEISTALAYNGSQKVVVPADANHNVDKN